MALIILGAATSGLFLANILKIPQSTSQVTVGAIAGASMGGKKVTPTLVISFVDDGGNSRQLPLEGNKLDAAHKMMVKKYGL